MLIDKKRFLKDFKDLGRIGHVQGEGVAREAYSANYFKARDFIEGLMKASCMETRVDSVGNLFGKYSGNGKAVLVGSHLDSVVHGGIYDGHLGVMAALEAARALREKDLLDGLPVEMVAFIGEEAGPLGGTFGSRSMTGTVETTVIPDFEYLKKIGLTIDDVRRAKEDISKYRAFLELHIEGASQLDKSKIKIGVLTGTVCINRHKVEIYGVANHAGTTPMKDRDNALQKATNFLADWFEWVDNNANGDKKFVSNIGCFEVFPYAVAIVPEKVSFILEIRSLEDEVAFVCAQKFKDMISSLGSSAKVVELGHKGAAAFERVLINKFVLSCEKANLSYKIMPSGASYDGTTMALSGIPTAMIFAPSVNGVSHSPLEFTSDEDAVNGAEVLARMLLEMKTF